MSKKYRVWHIPQLPMPPFKFETDSLEVAKAVDDALCRYDIFEFDNRVKPDFCNAGGISEWSEEEQEWWDLDEEEDY